MLKYKYHQYTWHNSVIPYTILHFFPFLKVSKMVKQNRKRHKSTDSSSSRTEHDIINRNEKENEVVKISKMLESKSVRVSEPTNE